MEEYLAIYLFKVNSGVFALQVLPVRAGSGAGVEA